MIHEETTLSSRGESLPLDARPAAEAGAGWLGRASASLYFLSALCMLAGCYLLGRAYPPAPGQIGRILALLGVLQAYEGLLIALALLLIVRLGNRRDGLLLLLLEAVFLADGTHLWSEGFLASPGKGWLLGAAALALGALKAGAVLLALRIRLPARILAFLALQYAALLGLPAFLACRVSSPDRPEALFYGAFLAAGFLPAARSLLAREPLPAPIRAASCLIQASLILHLLGAAWIHHAPFRLSYLSPVALGAWFAVARTLRRRSPDAVPAFAQLAIPALALVAALDFPRGLPVLQGIPLTPFRIALVLAGLAHLEAARARRLGPVALAGYAHLAAALAGATPVEIGGTASRIAGALARQASAGIPRTAEAWGIAAIAAAFLLLALGAAASLRRANLLRRPPP